MAARKKTLGQVAFIAIHGPRLRMGAETWWAWKTDADKAAWEAAARAVVREYKRREEEKGR